MSKKIKKVLKEAMQLSIIILVVSGGMAQASLPVQDSWSWRIEAEQQKSDELQALRVNSHTQLYKVKGGDTLWGIARILRVDLNLLAAMNYIKPEEIIYVGQNLVVPVEPEKQYYVRPGDTLWSIANSYEVDVKSVMAANRISKPENLRAGEIIIIPGSPSTVAVSARINPSSSRLSNYQLLWPLRGVITSPYGQRGKEFHHGLDIAGEKGDPIKAALSGTVTFSGWKNSIYGNAVEIWHSNGLVTVYAHNSKNQVKEGDRVAAGQQIAAVGSTGRTTGPHLHLEVHLNGKPVDPRPYLK